MILYIGDNPQIQTGMGIVSRYILNALSQSYPDEQIIALVRYPSVNAKIYTLPKNVSLIILPQAKFSISESAEFILNYIQGNLYSIKFILCQGDVFYFEFFHFLRRAGIDVPIVGYLNIDAADIPVKSLETLSCFDAIIFPTEFTKKEYEKICRKYAFPINKNIYIIPHGLSDNFIPPRISDKKYSVLTFLTVANNILRKNWKLLFKALSELKEKSQYPFQWIIVSKIRGDSDLLKEAIYYRLLENIIFQENVSDEKLKEFYSLSHYLLLGSLGEGFCLPIIESISQGTPCILPDNSVFKDVAKDCAVYYHAPSPLATIHSYVFMAPALHSLIEKLNLIYTDFYLDEQKLYRKLIRNIQEYQSKLLSGKAMGERIVKIVSECSPQKSFISEEQLLARQLNQQNVDLIFIPVITSISDILNKCVVLYSAKQKLNKKFMLVNYYGAQFQQIFKQFVFSGIEIPDLKYLVFENNFIDLSLIPIEDLIQKYGLKKEEITFFPAETSLNANILPAIYILYHPGIIELSEIDAIIHTFKDKQVFINIDSSYIQIPEKYFAEHRVSTFPIGILLNSPQAIKIVPLTEQTYHLYVFDFPNTIYLSKIDIPTMFLKEQSVIFKDSHWLEMLSLKIK